MAEGKSFEFAVPEGKTAETVLERARDQARRAGIVMVGDATKGSFRGLATGNYTVQGRQLRVTVTDKPRLAPWSLVESTLKKLFT